MTAAEVWERLQARDVSLWPAGSVAATHLGWVDSPARYAKEAAELRRWADGVDARHVIVLGMGGSSLGPEVLRAAAGSDRLVVLDTTDPRTVTAAPFDDAFVVVSSKSGGTLEVQALLAYAWDRLGGDGSRFAAVTDPGTSLATLARDRGFARVFENDPAIGGRYSVLSYFGLVPAALLGYDVARLCERATGIDGEEAVELGLAMGEAARTGRDKVTVRVAPTSAAFGLWIEQLIAESTGKGGRGCIPVPTTEAEEGADRFTVSVHVGERYDLGAEFYRWEVATAVAGHVLAIDPFDQPNVAESKENTARVLARRPLPAVPHAAPATVGEWLRATVTAGDYVSVQAYLPYDQADALEGLRRRVRDALGGVPVTAGFGPRFLHSTGQLHKGGPDSVVSVQLVPTRPSADVPVPGEDHDFGTLLLAQSIGDHESLLAHGRRVLRVGVDDAREVVV